MKTRKLIIIFLLILTISNAALTCFCIYERNNSDKINKVWDLASSNATFLYQQYDEIDIPEAYDYALGEMGTICNVISYIDYGENNQLSETQKIELSTFYKNLYTMPEIMKQHISEIRNIVKLLQDKDDGAFIKMKELRDRIQ